MAIWCAGNAAFAGTEISQGEAERGEYLFRAAGCAGCHTDRDGGGELLAGGRALETPFGTFYTPNITPHPEYGIGRWTDAEFMRAMTEGTSPNGDPYYPAFPYPAYAGMERADVLALKSYLFTVPPVAQANRTHDLPWYLSFRFGLWIWRWWYFSPDDSGASEHSDPVLQRGAYLVGVLAHCGECHTPRDRFGGLIPELRHAGTRDGPDGDTVPNITPDRQSGIGKWSREDLTYYLETGLTPDGDSAGGLMAEVIDEGTRHLTRADLDAVAGFVLSLPSINNVLKKRRTPAKRDDFAY